MTSSHSLIFALVRHFSIAHFHLSVHNLKRAISSSECMYSFFRNNRFALNEILKPNISEDCILMSWTIFKSIFLLTIPSQPQNTVFIAKEGRDNKTFNSLKLNPKLVQLVMINEYSMLIGRKS